ncbi:MAG: hypothetical protein ACI4MS_07195 [Candidatus Coproplasma sp.]
MEELCRAVSETLIKTGGNGYKIFYEDELIEALPEDFKNRETLEAVLKKLDAEGFIDVKYARGEAFCIAVIKEYEIEEACEEVVPQTATCKLDVKDKKFYIISALSAFVGGLIGGCVVALAVAVS